MKIIAAMMAGITAPLGGGSARALVRLVIMLVGSIALFSVGFHVIMAMEGREFSWLSGVYWTVVTMSTLGFGDIVFESDLGRFYSIVVLFTGAVLILVLLPFTFIQLVYLPWRDATREARAPRRVPDDLRGHLIVTGRDPLEEALIHRAVTAGVPYVLLVEDIEEAVALHDLGYRVMVGALDDPQTYRAAAMERAAMLVTARSDQSNANIAFTAREVTPAGLVVATASSPDSVDVLELAGADHVIELGPSLGHAFARRILSPGAQCSVISTFEDLAIAEASAAGTELVGRSLSDLDLRERFAVSVVGIWDRGALQIATPDLKVEESSILLLAGRREALDAYDEAYASDVHDPQTATDQPVIILGGGRVGRATAQFLAAEGIASRIVEQRAERVQRFPDAVIGNAADLEVLQEAGIEDTPAVVVTTHDDDTNIYLTLYCRKLRPDIEILGRVRLDRNISTMHRAGADFVLSYASTGATNAWNRLRDDSTLLLAEGLVVFRVDMPERLAGRELRTTDIPARTGCSIIGIVGGHGCRTDLSPDDILPRNGQLILIGDDRAEERFFERYVAGNGNGTGPLTRLRALLRSDR
jgi:voltage-gated potassium channel